MEITIKKSIPLILLSAVSIGAGYYNLTIVVPFIGNDVLPNVSKFQIALVTQFALGFALAAIKPRYWLLLSTLTGALSMGTSIVGILINLNEHNLWPIELFFGVAFIVPAIAGAALARNIDRRQINNTEQTE